MYTDNTVAYLESVFYCKQQKRKKLITNNT